MDITSNGVKYNLNKLRQLNIIERIGPDKGGYWKNSQIVIFYTKNKRIMIRLEKTNAKNIWNILKLKISDEQMEFVASNDLSIIETYIAIISNGHAFPFGIF